MPNPLKLLIQRKTKVPTKHQNVHLWRSDWIKKYMVDYSESRGMFNSIGGGVIETDAQFCKWIRDKFGNGIYLVIAWRKGRKGFWNFMKVELFEDKFRRLPKNPSPEEIELKNELSNIKTLQKNKIYKSGTKKREVESEIQSTEEYTAEIRKEIKNTKKGCYPYLRSLQPIYGWHNYEDYKLKQREEEFVGRII